ncbi:class I SAM-dependent methyltransferase [Longimicrobium sp.]|uniref:class I SAM-dependent methyltransferase n=1 Tax=Longimicrobium sp. TaxID=2029185 RepID=UPI002B76376C|nr:class I SAM-dependent methyltransferase [Longimicrobium sp.]HSU15209.1 class I SAM-dependent methyltransferase [Longimicrobium sp.]
MADATAGEAATAHAGFTPVPACWICGGTELRPVNRAIFEFGEYRRQDPELARYTGATVDLVRCARCGFGQPAALPSLERFFDRMYDQRWSREWMADEFRDATKDLIFRSVLGGLAKRLPPARRTLLDVGAHVGRLIHVASKAGWTVEGVEVNPSTSAYAVEATGLTVHRAGLRDLADEGRRFDAVTMVDVLEHIPEPVGALKAAVKLLAPGGWIAVKVPEGRNQLRKELIRGRVRPGYRPTVADNLVHVNHFTAESLRRGMEQAGLESVTVGSAAPVLPPHSAGAARRIAGSVLPMAFWTISRTLPGGVRSPLALNLIAFGRQPG